MHFCIQKLIMTKINNIHDKKSLCELCMTLEYQSDYEDEDEDEAETPT